MCAWATTTSLSRFDVVIDLQIAKVICPQALKFRETSCRKRDYVTNKRTRTLLFVMTCGQSIALFANPRLSRLRILGTFNVLMHIVGEGLA
jgi:hypothetical protein